MTKIKLMSFAIVVIVSVSVLKAQNNRIRNISNASNSNTLVNSESAKDIETKTETHYSGNWIIGAGINMVENTGNQIFGDFFSFKNKNLGTPFMLSAEYLVDSQFSLGANILFNKYQSGKDVQGLIIQDESEPNYFAIDFAAKLFLREILHKHVFTPYVTAGAGYTNVSGYQAASSPENLVDVPKTQDITLNAGIGAYYWIDRSWGLNFNYIGKFTMKAGANDTYKTNHLVSSFSVFYRFDTSSN